MIRPIEAERPGSAIFGRPPAIQQAFLQSFVRDDRIRKAPLATMVHYANASTIRPRSHAVIADSLPARMGKMDPISQRARRMD